MATQDTGTIILNRARLLAQDKDASSNFAVSAADALIMLNDVLYAYCNNVRCKPKWVDATTSGLTFTGNTYTKTTTDNMNMSEVESFHRDTAVSATHTFGTGANTLPIAPALTRVSVQTMMRMIDDGTGSAPVGGTVVWTHVAAEKQKADTAASGVEKWRVWVFPSMSASQYMLVRGPAVVQLSIITDIPDIDKAASFVISKLLAYEIANLKADVSQQFIDNILAGVPKDALPTNYGGALRRSQLQDKIEESNQ